MKVACHKNLVPHKIWSGEGGGLILMKHLVPDQFESVSTRVNWSPPHKFLGDPFYLVLGDHKLLLPFCCVCLHVASQSGMDSLTVDVASLDAFLMLHP